MGNRWFGCRSEKRKAEYWIEDRKLRGEIPNLCARTFCAHIKYKLQFASPRYFPSFSLHIRIQFEQVCRFCIKCSASELECSFMAENRSDFYVFLARYKGTRVLTLQPPPQISLLRALPVPRVKVLSLHGSHILCFTNADNVLTLPQKLKITK